MSRNKLILIMLVIIIILTSITLTAFATTEQTNIANTENLELEILRAENEQLQRELKNANKIIDLHEAANQKSNSMIEESMDIYNQQMNDIELLKARIEELYILQDQRITITITVNEEGENIEHKDITSVH